MVRDAACFVRLLKCTIIGEYSDMADNRLTAVRWYSPRLIANVNSILKPIGVCTEAAPRGVHGSFGSTEALAEACEAAEST